MSNFKTFFLNIGDEDGWLTCQNDDPVAGLTTARITEVKFKTTKDKTLFSFQSLVTWCTMPNVLNLVAALLVL